MTYASLKHVGLNALRLCCNKEARTAVMESAGASTIRRLARSLPLPLPLPATTNTGTPAHSQS